MEIHEFQNLAVQDVAQLVRTSGPKVCVFPINGTRRWFVLEHAVAEQEGQASLYAQVAAKRHVDLYALFFDHGVDTLLTPIFGPDLLERGEEYAAMATAGLALLASDPIFVDFYDRYRVRVRFYGDYRQYFASGPYDYLLELFEGVTSRTSHHDRHRLFIGVCGQDATMAVARLAIAHHAQTGEVPSKQYFIEAYYGENPGPVNLFIGFDQFSVFDMPLVATGNEDLYFTVCPSPYLSSAQLRGILYDHLYTRHQEPDYAALGPDDWHVMQKFYRLNQDKTLGIGINRGSIWYPLARIELPAELQGPAVQ